MSETKRTLGQIAKAAFIDRLGQSSPILQSDGDEAWEAAADAVAEECAKIADAASDFVGDDIRAFKSKGEES